MIPKGLFTHVALILLSVLIVLTYIKPSLQTVGSLQDSIVTYKEEQKKVETVNQKLQNIKQSIDEIPKDDQTKLMTYMPNRVDEIAVPRDVKYMADRFGLQFTAVRYDGSEKSSTETDVTNVADVALAEAHTFTFELAGTYSQIKELVRALEQNHYPLEIQELQLTKREGGFLAATLKVRTYNRVVPVKAKALDESAV